MKKQIAMALTALGCTLTGSAAQAGNVYWSVGISAPPVATVISNGPVYVPAPVVYAPPPPVYVQEPVYYAPPPHVIYRPVPVVVYGGGYGGYYGRGYHHGWRQREWRERDDWRYDGRGDTRRHH